MGGSLEWLIVIWWMYRTLLGPFMDFDTWRCRNVRILALRNPFKANRWKVIGIVTTVVMVRWVGRIWVACVLICGGTIDVLRRWIWIARSVIIRWMAWLLVQFKSYRLNARLKAYIRSWRWSITRHLVCCLFTFGTEIRRSSVLIGNMQNNYEDKLCYFWYL